MSVYISQPRRCNSVTVANCPSVFCTPLCLESIHSSLLPFSERVRLPFSSSCFNISPYAKRSINVAFVDSRGILFFVSSCFSILYRQVFAMRGPRGEPSATPSTCWHPIGPNFLQTERVNVWWQFTIALSNPTS